MQKLRDKTPPRDARKSSSFVFNLAILSDYNGKTALVKP